MMKQPPQHVAIIMDGNGRWAKRKNLPRKLGHREGVKAVRRIVRHAFETGVQYLTLYGFSTENWQRPDEEVMELMRLLRFYLKKELSELHKNGVRLRVIGTRAHLPEDICSMVSYAEGLTKDNEGGCLVIALSYSGRQEIVQAVQRLVADCQNAKQKPENLSPELFANYLDTADIPDPDLVIRTSGEQRISNFLLWQAAYSEFVFTPTFWPDFQTSDFDDALRQYSQRERRFGRVDTQNIACNA